MEIVNIYVGRKRKKIWKEIKELAERENRSLSEMLFLILREWLQNKKGEENDNGR